MTSFWIPSAFICSTASSANGVQYRIATYSFEETPRLASSCLSANACWSIVAFWGERPPTLSMISRAAGASVFAMNAAIGCFSAHEKAGGSVRISGSQKTLYRYSSTSSFVSGEPTERSSTPIGDVSSRSPSVSKSKASGTSGTVATMLADVVRK